MNKQKQYLSIAKSIARKIEKEFPIVSIYLKGSVVRDEVVPNSDIDLVVILPNAKNIKKIKKLQDEIVQIATYTIRELKSGKPRNDNKHTPPKITNLHFHHFLHLAGEKIDPTKLPKPDLSKRFKFMIKHAKKHITNYYNRKCGFGDVVKQTLWLAHYHLLIEKNIDLYKWEEVVKHFPKNHIYQQAYKYRIKRPKKRGKICDKFNLKLEKYLDNLEKKYTNQNGK